MTYVIGFEIPCAICGEPMVMMLKDDTVIYVVEDEDWSEGEAIGVPGKTVFPVHTPCSKKMSYETWKRQRPDKEFNMTPAIIKKD